MEDSRVSEGLERFVEAFRRVLELSWDLVKAVDPYGADSSNYTSELMCDWQQAQWEILVEHNLVRAGLMKGSLVIYGSGAETESSRITEPCPGQVYEVCCVPKDGNSLVEVVDGVTVEFPERGWLMDEFVGLIPGYYQDAPPFDGVLLTSPHGVEPREEWVFRRDEVRFVLSSSNYSSVGAPMGMGDKPEPPVQ